MLYIIVGAMIFRKLRVASLLGRLRVGNLHRYCYSSGEIIVIIIIIIIIIDEIGRWRGCWGGSESATGAASCSSAPPAPRPGRWTPARPARANISES